MVPNWIIKILSSKHNNAISLQPLMCYIHIHVLCSRNIS